MTSLFPSSGQRKPEATASCSSGTAFDGGWRARWREQARIDHTDWPSLHHQLVSVWRALRSLADETSS